MPEIKRFKLILSLILLLLPAYFLQAQPIQAEPIQAQPKHELLSEMPPANQRRPEQTFLTFPEWFIVYISADYAQVLKQNRPSDFPYFGYIWQFWQAYAKVYALTKDRYPLNLGYHVMIMVIGISTTVELTLKGLYENSWGKWTEQLAAEPTSEDVFAANTAQAYVDFIKVYPWYQFDFGASLQQLWFQTSWWGHHWLRKWERKIILTKEYGFKAVYAWLIKKLTLLSYGEESAFTLIWVDTVPHSLLSVHPDLKVLKQVDSKSQWVLLKRYDAFKDEALLLAQAGLQFHQIAGNQTDILLSFIAPCAWQKDVAHASILFKQPILIEPTKTRIAISVPVGHLSQVLNELSRQGLRIEHIYDY